MINMSNNGSKTRGALSNDKLIDTLNKRFDQFETKFDDLSSKIAKQVEKLEQGVSEQRKKDLYRIESIEKTQSDVDRTSRLRDIIIRNVPRLSTENLHDIFHRICSTIGFKRDPVYCVDAIFRLGLTSRTRKRNSTNFPAIMVKFTSQLAKAEFMNKYFAYKTLALNNIGYSSSDRIYIRK